MRSLRRALPLAFFLCGCSLLGQLAGSAFDKPQLQFKEARLPHVDFQGAQLDLVFLVTNPNSVGIDVASAKYLLQVEGHDLLGGQPPHGLKIPAGGTAEVVFPAAVKWTDVAPALTALFAQDQVHYKASGEVGLNSPVGLLTLPLSHEGTFAPPRMPAMSIGTPQLQSVSLTSARILLPLKIDNANAFPIPLAGLVGSVSMAGANVGQLALSEQAPVPAGKGTTINLPLQVNFLTAGQAVAQAIHAGVVDVKIDATLNAAGATLPFSVAQTVQIR